MSPDLKAELRVLRGTSRFLVWVYLGPCMCVVFSVICVTGPGRGLLGSPVETPAEPLSASRPSPGGCWIPGKFLGPSKVHSCEVSSQSIKAAGSQGAWRLIKLFWASVNALSVAYSCPVARCRPAWICWSPGSIVTLTPRTAVENRSFVMSACMGPFTLPARPCSTRSSSDTEPCWRPTWRKVRSHIYWTLERRSYLDLLTKHIETTKLGWVEREDERHAD